MQKGILFGSIAIAGLITAAIFFDNGDQGSIRPGAEARPDGIREGLYRSSENASVTVQSKNRMSARARALTQAANDPRLINLLPSQDNGLIEFVTDPDGRVLKEIDKDPSSFGFKKPLKEYYYVGERPVGVTKSHYLGNQVAVTTITVTYKADGSIDQYKEAINYQPQQKESQRR